MPLTMLNEEKHMPKINSRNKGANGEREAGRWLQEQFKLEKTPRRNLEQVRSGGHDLEGFQPFCIEVKRSETIDKRSWWLQVTHSLTDEYFVPVVMYRQNGRKWKFLISGKHIGIKNGFMQLEEREFKLWVPTIQNRLERVKALKKPESPILQLHS